jgi:hypothetical protein
MERIAVYNIRICAPQPVVQHLALQSQHIDFDTPTRIITGGRLIELVVTHQVRLFNDLSTMWQSTATNPAGKGSCLPIVTDLGKPGFRLIYKRNKADLECALENAVLAFEEGMYTVFYGDDEVVDLNKQILLEQTKL